jgi:type III restriction enzyme
VYKRQLQQIGRGLRLCVNQDLQRNTLNYLNDDQEQFWSINNLDVVVSSKEQGFVEAIQNEILSNSFLIATTFTEQELKIALKEKSNFDDQTVRRLYKMLENKEMIIYKATVNGLDVFEKSPDFAKLLKEQNLPEEQVKALKNLFATDASAYIQKAEKKKEKKNVFIKATHLQEFQRLWNAINKNAFYVLDTLSEEQENQLVQNIATEIEVLNIEEILLQTIRAELNVSRIGKEGAITETLTGAVSYKSKLDYLELVRTLSNNTKTPLAFVVKIFNALSNDFKTKMLSNNPEQAQRDIAAIIRKNLVAMLKASITYHGLSGTVLPNVFKTEGGKTYLDKGSTGKFQKDISGDFSLKAKWVFEDVIEYDSDFELEIVEQDPNIDSIEIFAKLPRLKIKTPLGDYNPDFCYAVKSAEGKKIFLVVEAKGYKSSTAIPDDEKTKIDFAKKYFAALSEQYNNDAITISFKERINTTQLAALINNA